jgi:hypothetical protein
MHVPGVKARLTQSKRPTPWGLHRCDCLYRSIFVLGRRTDGRGLVCVMFAIASVSPHRGLRIGSFVGHCSARGHMSAFITHHTMQRGTVLLSMLSGAAGCKCAFPSGYAIGVIIEAPCPPSYALRQTLRPDSYRVRSGDPTSQRP